MPIPYGRQSVNERDIAAVTEVLRGDWLTQGPTVAEFEQAVAMACDVPHAVAFSSGTGALHGAAFAAGLGPGDELVTSAITFAASANCGAYVGATPRFADIDPATWNVSPETLAPVLSERTKAVVPVHFAGLPAPVEALRELLGDEVTIVEDAAHALGARSGDEPIGACRHADMATFSFHPVKGITSAEGGMVTTRDPELAERLRRFRNHGLVKEPAAQLEPDGPWHQEQHELSFNYRLSDVHSALGLSQLGRLGEFVARRNAIADRYRAELGDLDAIELPPPAPEGSLHAYHLFVVRHRAGAEERRRHFEGLRERGVLVQVHYLPVYRHPYYARVFGYEKGLCPAAEEYYAGCLSLPCFPAVTDEQQTAVVAAVRELVAA